MDRPSNFSSPKGGAPLPSDDAVQTNPSNPVDNRFEIMVDPQKATLVLHGAHLAHLPPPDSSAVERVLFLHHVQHRVDWIAVERILAERDFGQPHIIATGTPIQEGRNAYIEEKVKFDSDGKPQLLLDGTVDYKNIENIHPVREGEVLAVKHPAIPGIAGRDVFGHDIPAKPVKDIKIRVGANTTLSPDGLSLLASISGFAFRQAGSICVGKTYLVKGNVDFKTGNIRYQGDVVVLGNVTDGFSVEADGEIVIEGSVEAGHVVSREGGIRIKQGIFGHGRAYLAAGKSIHILGALDARIECGGQLEVEREMWNCRVVAEMVKADRLGCCVLGGSIKSYSCITIAVLGAEGCRTELTIVDRLAESAEIRMVEIEGQLKQLKARLEALERKLVRMKAMADKFGARMSARALREMKDALGQRNEWAQSMAELELERKVRLVDLDSAPRHVGTCQIIEKAVGGACLNLYGERQDMGEFAGGREWRWTPKGLVYRITGVGPT